MVGYSHNALPHYDLVHSDSTCPTSESSVLNLCFTCSTEDADVNSSAQCGSAFPLGFSIEPKLQEWICKGLFVLLDIILLSELGASIDHYHKNLLIAPEIDARTWPLMAKSS